MVSKRLEGGQSPWRASQETRANRMEAMEPFHVKDCSGAVEIPATRNFTNQWFDLSVFGFWPWDHNQSFA